MIPIRMSFFAAAFAFACSVSSLQPAHAQPSGYPARPVRIIVGFPPGGSTDIAARMLAAELSQRLKQPVIVENRSGAGGIVGLEALAKSTPDGHTLGVGASGSLTIAPVLREDLPYKVAELAPVSLIVNNPLIVAGSLGFPPQSIAEIISFAKAQANGLPYGSGGQASAMHLAGALLASLSGTQLIHVAYRGNSPVVQDLAAGHIPLAIVDVASVREFIRQGRVRGIATTGAQRSKAAPQLPTVAEAGLPNFVVTSWFGILAPAGTPLEIVQFLSREIAGVIGSAGITEKFLAAGLEPSTTTPEQFAELIRSESDRYRTLIKQTGITVR